MNDENLGVFSPGKRNNSINAMLALDQPTGRPSILRQTENLPSKTVSKGTKVHFLTFNDSRQKMIVKGWTYEVGTLEMNPQKSSIQFIDICLTD